MNKVLIGRVISRAQVWHGFITSIKEGIGEAEDVS